MILVMTVIRALADRNLCLQAAKKIAEVRKIVGPDIRVEVDGGIDSNTAPRSLLYGADTLVAGNAIFAKPTVAAIKAIRKAAS